MTEEELLQKRLDEIGLERTRNIKDLLGPDVDVRIGMISAKEILEQLSSEQEELRKKIEADIRKARQLRWFAFVCLGIGILCILMQVVVLIAY